MSWRLLKSRKNFEHTVFIRPSQNKRFKIGLFLPLRATMSLSENNAKFIRLTFHFGDDILKFEIHEIWLCQISKTKTTLQNYIYDRGEDSNPIFRQYACFHSVDKWYKQCNFDDSVQRLFVKDEKLTQTSTFFDLSEPHEPKNKTTTNKEDGKWLIDHF